MMPVHLCTQGSKRVAVGQRQSHQRLRLLPGGSRRVWSASKTQTQPSRLAVQTQRKRKGKDGESPGIL